MARVALAADRETWPGGSIVDSVPVMKSNGKLTGTSAVILPTTAPDSDDLFASRLKSVAFSLDDDEARRQASEYVHKLHEDEEEQRQRQQRQQRSNAPTVSSGWTHGAEMKFEARELLVTKSVPLSGPSSTAKRAEIREYFHRTFSVYERLFELLSDSSVFYRRPDSLRHPLIFYYGHTAVFFINKLMLGKFISKRIDEKMESTCAIGVDEMSWDDLNDAHYDWPTPESVRNYRNLVRSTVDDVIQSAPLELPIRWDSPFWVVLMGIEHERIHLETSSVLIRQLPLECVRPHPLWQLCPKQRRDITGVPSNSLIPLKGGEVTLGKDVENAELYGWDNEYGRRVRRVAPFSVSQYLVSNAEWLEFMADGAYDRQEYWSEEGWKFIQFKNKERKHPIFWVPAASSTATRSETFRYRALAEVIDMPWDWPVEVNELEAKAFANWKALRTGKKIRLPTEDEFHQMRDLVSASSISSSSSNSNSLSSSLGDQPFWPTAPGNINLEFYASSNPVDEFAFVLDSGVELFDVVGNVWQHTETPIAPFGGFQFHPLYDDFSIPTFDNKHNIIVGGSWISTGNEATRSARYAFRRHFYQHAGIRYVESEEDVVVEELPPSTETDVVVANMAAAHFSQIAAPFLQLPNPFIQLAKIIMAAVETERFRFTRTPFRSPLLTPRDLAPMDLAQLEGVAHLPPAFESILDLGCGGGRLCFELAFSGNHPNSGSAGARAFDTVLGIDQSTRFLRVGDSLKTVGKFHYLVKSEGDLDGFHAINLSDEAQCQANQMLWANDPAVRQQVCARVSFMQSDAHNFDGKYTGYDVVVLAHLLEDMYDPALLLSILHTRCKLGGILVIASDYHWRTERTAKSKWLGGKKEATGESVNTLNALETALASHFIRVSKPQNVQQMRRITDRVSTLHNSEVTVWRRFK